MRGSPLIVRLLTGVRRPGEPFLGVDVAGTVESVGPEARTLKPGDRVFGDLIRFGMGAFAEYVCAPDRAFQLIPDELSFEEAATLPHSALLAVMGLKPYWGQELRPGDSVMVVGASGNVGPFAVQIAKARGLRVTGVCRTEKIDFVRSLGADEVIDYTTTDYTKSGPYDRIVDVDAHRSIFGYRKALKPHGVYISMGGNGIWILSFFAAALTFSERRKRATPGSRRYFRTGRSPAPGTCAGHGTGSGTAWVTCSSSTRRPGQAGTGRPSWACSNGRRT